ncbi:alpha-1,4-glucan:maltose-1-phosphate maltosyltransferase 2 [Nocardioides phosphati]|uniref:Alpha-1,4-glucan:maltose-1-phosphate maltosyltransferase n=1 Tax=Nocardioides phosphati TaxID=1867775 RepID=A0ABQ2N6N6_9ACTN|nr:maltotransferase domain-containing protein [Nocardioides phosphati]GGO84593.1 alpha-1,4-glucan:maltose-1-phosphate maltosyltransferase 2 [Nocardioides phosphati]
MSSTEPVTQRATRGATRGVIGRIPVMEVAPVIEGGALPTKAAVGEPFDVTALVFREGHDALGAEVVLTDPRGKERAPVRMQPLEHERARLSATVAADEVGAWTFRIQAWSDPLETWHHAATVKIRAGVDVDLMFAEGVALLTRWLAGTKMTRADRPAANRIRKVLADDRVAVETRLAMVESPELLELFARYPLRDLLTVSGAYPFFVDPERALASSWYEFFPRSEGAYADADGRLVSGTFRTAAERLPAVAAMGFDIIYLPPIHPIGEVNRKGPNNVVLDPPGEHPADWVGSPWAVGSKDGGHDAIHPDLGSEADFRAFVARANELGLEVALDFALQAAPDHPWVTEHPEWFTTRVDGSIAYAENPPKKYQDIYPVNFDNDYAGILAESERILRHWMKLGVRTFRVDNPHTKPVHFWADLLAAIRRTDPDVVFLAEAFTQPAMLQALGAVGFQQSYCYFTWRNERREIEDYLREVSHETSHRIRPSFWVNTPDILPTFLQSGRRAAFQIRAVLAATGSSSWGVYAGFELLEHTPLRPGAEEYLHSEKFELKVRDWAAAEERGESLAPYLTRLNEIRRSHPALRQLRNVAIHRTDDDAVLCFSKRDVVTGDLVIVVVNLDPTAARETTVHLDMPALGLDWHDEIEVEDLLSPGTWRWSEHTYVHLDPATRPAHVLSARRSAKEER